MASGNKAANFANIIMKKTFIFALSFLILGLAIPLAALPAEPLVQDKVFYAGSGADAVFWCAHRLSDGTIVIGGGAKSIEWLKKQAKVAALGGALPEVIRGERSAFLIHLSADLGKLLGAVALPVGFANEIRTIRSTETPGQPTGALHVSGSIQKNGRNGKPGAGYFIARLDHNFLAASPSAAEWVIALESTGALAETQPWDVGADGRVVFAQGGSYGNDWMSVDAVDATGTPTVVPDWPRHWHANGEYEGLAKDSPKPVMHSGIILKIAGRGDFRSSTRADFELESSDGNGGVKKGKWPFDAMFDGYFDLQTRKTSPVTGTGKGYYGYRWGGNACAHVGAIAIDRRNGRLFIGGNNKSKLPDGLPDFEPWVVAMEASGRLMWWQRLYAESKGVSTPDQYVDGIAVDYRMPADKGGAVVVLARAHGNNVNNFWTADGVVHAANPKTGYQKKFTGKNGNIHYQWIGRMTADKGEMLHATYAAEFTEGAKFNLKTRMKDPLLDHWPDINAGWPDFNTTRLRPVVALDATGAVHVVGTGRNTVTTRNAWQAFPSPLDAGRGIGSWNDFVRVYQPDLTSLAYSSLLTGAWDRADGKGGGNVTLRGVCPVPGGVIAVGGIKADGADLPTANAPAWGSANREGSGAVVALLGIRPIAE